MDTCCLGLLSNCHFLCADIAPALSVPVSPLGRGPSFWHYKMFLAHLVFFFCLSPRISYFSKEPGSFYWRMILRDQDLGPGARFTFLKRTQIPELPTFREASRCLAQHHVGACLVRPQCPAHNSSLHTCLYFFKSFQSAGLRH